MKKIIFTMILIVAGSFATFAAEANPSKNNPFGASSATVAAQVRTRYVRVRGKRYRVTYRTFVRNGRRYVRILSYRRA